MTAWTDLVGFYSRLSGVSGPLKRATLAQWILESGRGKSQLAIEHFNFAGLKFRARMTGICLAVDYRGSDGDLTTYCKFANVEKFVEGYWHFIASGPYDGWQQYDDDPKRYIRHLFDRGYAADKRYVEKVEACLDEAAALLSGGGAGAQIEPQDDHIIARVAIVVGHNRIAKGAPAAAPLSTTEFPFNSRVAQHMKDEADEYNLLCEVFFREPASSYSKEIAQAYAAVAQWKPDCCIELHFNSASPAATGSETLVGEDRPAGRSLADNVQGEMLSALGLQNRKVKIIQPGDRGGGSLYALPTVPTVIVEPFFGSNAGDCQKVGSLGEGTLARAYLRGLRDWAVARQL